MRKAVVVSDDPPSNHVVGRARADEAPAIAEVWLRSRRVSVPEIPATVHTDDEVRARIRTAPGRHGLASRRFRPLDVPGEPRGSTHPDRQGFYEGHGFVAVDMTEGDNEDGSPDVRYRWSVFRPPHQ